MRRSRRIGRHWPRRPTMPRSGPISASHARPPARTTRRSRCWGMRDGSRPRSRRSSTTSPTHSWPRANSTTRRTRTSRYWPAAPAMSAPRSTSVSRARWQGGSPTRSRRFGVRSRAIHAARTHIGTLRWRFSSRASAARGGANTNGAAGSRALPSAPFPASRGTVGRLRAARCWSMPSRGWADTIQFGRYLAAIEGGGGRVIFQCPRRLVRLLSGGTGCDAVLAEDQPPPPYDVHAPLMSLPRLLQVPPPPPLRLAPAPDRLRH